MSTAVINPLFSVPYGHLRSPVAVDDSMVSESQLTGLFRYIGDSENELIRYLAAVDSMLPSDWPLVLFGPTGVGKTALALAVVDQIRASAHGTISIAESRPNVLPSVLSAPDFVRRFYSAIDTNSVPDFRARIVRSPALFIDNVHLLADKPRAQDELIYLLDELDANHVPVILTVLGPLNAQSRLSVPLLSRLTEGLALELRAPGENARSEIIRELASIHGLAISDDAARWLGQSLVVTVPKLNHFLIQLKSRTESIASHQNLDKAFFQKLFRKSAIENIDEQSKTIIRLVAEEYQINASQLTSNSRKQSVVLARCVAIYLCRQSLNISFTRIGTCFGNRDHSTVMHAYTKITKLLELESESHLRNSVSKLKAKMADHFAEHLEFSLSEENVSKTSSN